MHNTYPLSYDILIKFCSVKNNQNRTIRIRAVVVCRMSKRKASQHIQTRFTMNENVSIITLEINK